MNTDQPTELTDARTSYQPLAWLERFSDDECERDACRLALNEIDRLRGTTKTQGSQET